MGEKRVWGKKDYGGKKIIGAWQAHFFGLSLSGGTSDGSGAVEEGEYHYYHHHHHNDILLVHKLG